jgi:hypothetical protein
MADDSRQFVPFLRTIDLFSGLSEEDLEKVASRFSLRSLQEGEPLFTGRAPEEGFYIIRFGKIYLRYGLEGSESRVLTRGRHFTEEDLLYRQPETAVITTDQDTELLHLDEGAYFDLLAEFPQIKTGLARTMEARRIIRSQGFDWLGEDEVIYYLARKHEALLIYGLLGPFGVFGLALTAIFLASSAQDPALWPAGLACSGGLAFLALLWGVWKFIDWGNDYYIVTNQRAVWVEKVIFLYESRDEAPLNYVLAVNTYSPYIGRLLHFGSVVIRTYTGEITFRYLPEPGRMAAVIEEYRQRLVRGSERIEKRRIDQAMRQRIWQERTEAGKGPPTARAPQPTPARVNPLRRLFTNLFTMRFEQDGVITYRKYWPTLLGKVWIPSLFALLVLAVLVYLLNGFRLGTVSLTWLVNATIVGFLVNLLIFAPWWLYQYVDWRNDIYQLTDKYLFDIERRPLGTEVKKSGPLENVLSLEHERKGFLGYILNYGFVTINVGGAQFIFREMHDPARVQQDIFDRIYTLRRQRETEEAAKDRRHLVDVIEIYHTNAEEFRQDDLYGDYDQDFGVELGSDGYP